MVAVWVLVAMGATGTTVAAVGTASRVVVFGNQKTPKFQSAPKTNKIMTHFHLMSTQKHKILSIVVLNMAKYTIISLILTDFVQIFFIFSLFRKHFRGSF